jgi:hypothetical protein
MLADLRAVLNRHVPAAEVDHAGAELVMEIEERSASSHGCQPSFVTAGRMLHRTRQKKRAAGTHIFYMRTRRPSVL